MTSFSVKGMYFIQEVMNRDNPTNDKILMALTMGIPETSASSEIVLDHRNQYVGYTYWLKESDGTMHKIPYLVPVPVEMWNSGDRILSPSYTWAVNVLQQIIDAEEVELSASLYNQVMQVIAAFNG